MYSTPLLPLETLDTKSSQPDLLSKLSQLRQVGRYGWDWLLPLGVTVTAKEMEALHPDQEEEDNGEEMPVENVYAGQVIEVADNEVTDNATGARRGGHVYSQNNSTGSDSGNEGEMNIVDSAALDYNYANNTRNNEGSDNGADDDDDDDEEVGDIAIDLDQDLDDLDDEFMAYEEYGDHTTASINSVMLLETAQTSPGVMNDC